MMLFRYLLLILCCLILTPSTPSSASDNDCKLIGYTECNKEDSCKKFSLFEQQDKKYTEVDSISADPGYKLYIPQTGSLNQIYTISPNGHKIAISEISSTDPLPLEAFVGSWFFNVTNKFQFVTQATDLLGAEGNVWSHSNDKYIYVDAYGHYQPGMFDLSGESSWSMWPPAEPLRNIRALNIAWSPDDQHIAIYGEEYPFPVSQNAINDVKTLYIATRLPDSSVEYKPISSPDYAAGTFTWLENNLIAFMQYKYDRTTNKSSNFNFQITSIDGKTIYSVDEYYAPFSRRPDNKLLVATVGENNQFIFSLFDYHEFTSQLFTKIPRTEAGGFPELSFSPDYASLIYLDPKTKNLVVQDIANNHDETIKPPVEDDIGWWTPDSKNILFVDYQNDQIFIYTLATNKIETKDVSEIFELQTHLPRYMNWLCQN